MNKIFWFCLCLATPLLAQERPPVDLQDVSPDGSMADRRLLAIVKKQQSLIERVGRTVDEAGNVDPALHRQIHNLSQEWTSYITDNAQDVEARILYGKFLNTFGQRESAVEQFIAADHLDDSLHVVKQQIGNYMAENGLYTEALPWFLQAIALAPKEPRYHFQMGELLYRYRWQFLEDEAFTRWGLDQEIKAAFREAALLMPNDFQVNLRYGESFYDMEKPEWQEALPAFENTLSLARSEEESQVVHLHIARVYSHLGNRKQSEVHLEQVNLPVLAAAKQQVVASLGAAKE